MEAIEELYDIRDYLSLYKLIPHKVKDSRYLRQEANFLHVDLEPADALWGDILDHLNLPNETQNP